MEKGTKCLITSFVIAVVILSALFSCGKRTTHTSHTNIKNDSLQISQNIELKQNATFSDIGRVRPFDASKPMLWNGAWHYNVVLEFDKSITSGVSVKANENLSYNGSEIDKSSKDSTRNNKGHIVAIISLIISTFALIYVLLKKYKVL